MDIVVGVDGSASSVQALTWALAEARLRGEATILAVHAFRPPETRSPYAYSYPYLPAHLVNQMVDQDRAWHEEQEAAVRRAAEDLLDRAIAAAGGDDAGIAIKRVVLARDPAPALIELSRTADLLVVGSRGRGGFRGLRLGSVSQHCLHHAHCPVVVVR